MTPNFFRYATNELSQDAFFCWLIEWSLERYKDINPTLHQASLKLLRYLIPNEFQNGLIVKSCEIFMQKNDMDFFIKINNSIIVHFEDKIKSHTDDRQLSKYKEILSNLYKNHEIYHVFLKTDLVWRHEKETVLKNGYKLIDLLQLIELLERVSSNSDIYDSFVEQIGRVVNEYQGYKILNPRNWSTSNWIGFIYDLSFTVPYVSFGKHYVGDGFWFVLSWHILPIGSVSFEIVNRKLVVKSHFGNEVGESSRKEFLEKLKDLLVPLFEQHPIKVYNRTANKVMLIDFFDFLKVDHDLLNFEKTRYKLIEIKNLFDDAINNYRRQNPI